jgi:hypothetical protein
VELPATHLALDVDLATGTDGAGSPVDIPAFLRPRHD